MWLQRSFPGITNGIWRRSTKLFVASRNTLQGTTPSNVRASPLGPTTDLHAQKGVQRKSFSTIATCKMPSNVEIKARLHDPDHLRALAKELADEKQTDVMKQVDTFFNCGKGRLKLREIVNHPSRLAKLIAYVRPDQDGPKQSTFSITEVEDAESLKRILRMALGVRGVVKKTRTLMMIGQTRLHIDEVEGLGNFMELEVVLERNQTQEEGTKIAQTLMKQLSINRSDLISGAYMDLLES